MNHNQACPDEVTLRCLLDGGVPELEMETYDLHIAECEHCQNLLQQITAEPGGWTKSVREASTPHVQDESALAEAIEALKKSPEAEAASMLPGCGEEFSLEFLSPPAKEDELGRIGQYEVREIIGRGGMGQVFKAFDPSLNRFVAIKVIAPQLATSSGARRRFKREARAAAAISHEHVVSIYSVDEVQGLPYLVMEYVPGISLQERVDRDGPLELKEILRIGMQTASGLAAAHAQGLVHRDIKPANILLENGVERVKITDFGLARMVDDASLTQSGILAGTPQYMAPEQACGEAQDHRVDLFSLGSVLYTLSTGHPPFRADSTMGVLRRVSDEQPRDVRSINSEMPRWFATIVKKLHAKKPADRYQTAAEVADILGRYLTHLQEPGPIPLPHQAQGGVKRVLRLQQRWAAAAAVLLVLLCGLGIAEATGANAISRFLSTVLRINTPQGTLIVEVDDPDVNVSVDQDGKEVTITGAGIHELKLRPGQHQWKATKDGKPIKSDVVTIQKNGKEVVKVSLEPLGSPSVQGQTTMSWKDEMVDSLVLPREVVGLAFTADGKRLATASADGALLLLDIAPGASGSASRFASWKLEKSTRLLQAHPADVDSVAFSPDGRFLAAGGKDTAVRLWDVPSLTEIRRLTAQPTSQVFLRFSPDAKALAAGTDRTVKLWDVATGKALWDSSSPGGPLAGVAIGPDGKTLAAASRSGTITFLDLATGKELLALRRDVPILTMAVSLDGRLIATTTSEERTVVLDATTGEVVKSTTHPRRSVASLAFSPDGKYLASGTSAGEVLVWELVGSSAPVILIQHQGPVTSLAFSPDGKTLASASKDRTIRLSGLATARLVGEMKGSGAVQANPKPIELQVRKQAGKTEILIEGGKLQPSEELATLLKNLAPKKDRLVNVTVATDVDYGTVRAILNAIQLAGLRSSITATDAVATPSKP